MTTSAENGAMGSTFTIALGRAGVKALKQVMTALRHRSEVRALYELDDRALKDIGLMRTDVTAALGAPLHFDPSRHLVDISGGVRAVHTPDASAPLSTRLRRPDAPMTDAAVTGLVRA